MSRQFARRLKMMAPASVASGSMSAPAFPSSCSSSSPCAACKFLRRKCQPDCVFAPYFPPHNPAKFSSVHKVFGASNVTKILMELRPHQRDDAVNSLAFEADMRLRDPVYGCVGLISFLQHQLREVEAQLQHTKLELAMYEKCSGACSGPADNGGNGLIFLNQQPVGVDFFAQSGRRGTSSPPLLPAATTTTTDDGKRNQHQIRHNYDNEIPPWINLMHGPYHAGSNATMGNNMSSANVAAPSGLHLTFAGVDGRQKFIGPT